MFKTQVYGVINYGQGLLSELQQTILKSHLIHIHPMIRPAIQNFVIAAHNVQYFKNMKQTHTGSRINTNTNTQSLQVLRHLKDVIDTSIKREYCLQQQVMEPHFLPLSLSLTHTHPHSTVFVYVSPSFSLSLSAYIIPLTYSLRYSN